MEKNRIKFGLFFCSSVLQTKNLTEMFAYAADILYWGILNEQTTN